MYKHFLSVGLGLALLGFVTLTASTLAIEVAEPLAVFCSGSCHGESFGSAVSESSCGALTQEELEELSQEACNDAVARSRARRLADVECSLKAGSRLCACTGGQLSTGSGVCMDSGTGSTITCKITYSGACVSIGAS